VPLYQKATIFEFVVKREWLEQVLAIVNFKDKAEGLKREELKFKKS